MRSKKGVSLIVLIITIIVMTILAGAVIISLSNAGIIGKASDAVVASDIANIQTQVDIVKGMAQLDAITNGEKLTQEKLTQEIQKHFKDSTVEGNIITVERGKYDIAIGEDLTISIGKHGEVSDSVKDIKVTYTTEYTGSGTMINLKIELLNNKKYEDYSEEEFEPGVAEEFLNGLDLDELLYNAAMADGYEDGEDYYNSEIQPDLIEALSYEEFINDSDTDKIVEESVGYKTAKLYVKYKIAYNIKDMRFVNYYVSTMLKAKEQYPEVSGKSFEELQDFIETIYDNEKTFDEITTDLVSDSFESWYGDRNDYTVEEAYVYTREQVVIAMIWDAFVDTHPILIEYPDGSQEEITFWTEQNIFEDLSYIITTPGDYTIKVTSPSGYTETIYLNLEAEDLIQAVPEKWQSNVVAIVNTVPIPKGFVASQATGENTKEGGLVIYEGTTPVTDANVEAAKRDRNQYVWVPVEDFSKFIRQEFGVSTEISNELGMEYWEVILDITTNMPLSTQSTSYITGTTLEEVQEMYESVKEYQGFYVARYEVGLDVESYKTGYSGSIMSNVHSKMNKAPYNYIKWGNSMSDDRYGAVEVARSIYPKTNRNYGVVSTLTYGVQWDRTLAWWVETKAQNGTGDIIISSDTQLNNSTLYGNHTESEISVNSFNDGAKYLLYSNSTLATTYKDVTTYKSSSVSWLLTTGATETARINNIYDMAGNLYEYTMEAYSNNKRIQRGGAYRVAYSSGVPRVTSRYIENVGAITDYFGFRVALYIKK